MSTTPACKAIKRLLVDTGHTQKELAAHLGHSEVYISNLLRGKAEIKLDTFLEIATFFGISGSELLKSAESKSHVPLAA